MLFLHLSIFFFFFLVNIEEKEKRKEKKKIKEKCFKSVRQRNISFFVKKSWQPMAIYFWLFSCLCLAIVPLKSAVTKPTLPPRRCQKYACSICFCVFWMFVLTHQFSFTKLCIGSIWQKLLWKREALRLDLYCLFVWEHRGDVGGSRTEQEIAHIFLSTFYNHCPFI